MTPNDDDVLMTFLETRVPMRVLAIRDWTPAQRAQEAARLVDVLASHGDALRHRGRGPRGQTARVFGAAATALAIGAYQPGGVTLAGVHWCVNHAHCHPGAAGRGWPDLEAMLHASRQRAAP